MTSTTQHTPGPWYIKRIGNEINAGSWEILCQLDDSFVAQLYRINKIPHKEVKANARLIAAAPELLKALNMIVNTENQDYITTVRTMREIAKQAIAKAEGR